MSGNGHLSYSTDEEVINALFKTEGNITKAAELLGLKSPEMLRQRIQDKQELRNARAEAQEQRLDMAEGIVDDAMKKGSKRDKLDTAKWYLSRKGRSRGYGEVVRTENLNLNIDAIEAAKERARNVPVEKRLELMKQYNANADTE